MIPPDALAATHCWDTPPATLWASDDTVHVWLAGLDGMKESIPGFRDTLADDERERAQAFCLPRDRDRFILARGILRALLARYLGADPQEIRLRYERHGKPALAPESALLGLSFNLSHSDGLALFAITRGRRVGVDVERVREDELSLTEIARRSFAPREARTLTALPAPARPRAFFACWTRKEAYLKARGDGLMFPLDRFDVSLAPGDPPRLLEVRGEPAESARWSLAALDAPPGYEAALAVEGRGWQLRCWRWDAP